MKRKIRSGLNLLVIIMTVSTLFVALNSNIDNGLSRTNIENSLPTKEEQQNFDTYNFFKASEFSNTSHQIIVSREITANQYCYTTSYTTIRLFLTENASQTIDAFNYTIPSHELHDTKYLEIYSPNDTNVVFTEVLATEEKNKSTTLVIKIPPVGKNQFLSIIIRMDHPNAISFKENAKLEESTHPYMFNLSFLPLISFPITSYEIDWKIGKNIRVISRNDSIQPTKDFFNGDFSGNTSYGLVFKNITEISTIDRNLLNSSNFGGYNLTALENLNFIPAYNPSLANNLSSYLSFEYFQDASTKIEFTELKSEVTVSEWGYVVTRHEITMRNSGIKSGSSLSTTIGGSTFPVIGFNIPETADNIGIRDNYGDLTTIGNVEQLKPGQFAVTPDIISPKKLVVIKPRVPISQNAEYDLYLSYRERVSDRIKDLGGGKIKLQIPLSMNFNWTIQRFEFNLFLPHGSMYNLTSVTSTIEQKISREFSQNSPIRKSELLRVFDKTGLKVILEDLTPLSNQYISIDFSISVFPIPYFIMTPLSICILFLGLGMAYVIIRNISFGFKQKHIALEEIPLDIIKEFVKSYEEKTAIREQILKLHRKRKSKNIKAREYEQTRIILRNRQQGIDRSIVNVSQKLAEESPRYRISMRSIEVAEANREDILQNIDSLEGKKTQGRIGKEAYVKLKIRYDKQLRKANNEVDKVLIDLRSLLTI